jgi:hypothetical protein
VPLADLITGQCTSFPPTIIEQQAQEQRVLEVLDSLRRLLDSP